MAEPRQLHENQSSGVEDSRIISIYICPKCGNYYGSSTMGRLEDQMNLGAIGGRAPGQPTHNKARCPRCGTERQRKYARIIPDEEVREIERSVRRRKPD